MKSELQGWEVSPPVADARGKACPLPIVDLARALKLHERVELWATDPAARGDLDSFCLSTGHQLKKVWVEGGVLKAWVERKRP